MIDRVPKDLEWTASNGAHETIPIGKLLHEQRAEIERLQRIIDSRPAINAGLPETYITWTHSIYELEAARGLGIVRG